MTVKKVYFFSGGGSGGHLTPLIAVAEELKRREPQAEIHAVVHRGDDLNSVVQEHGVFDAVHPIFAGKLRRYHGGGLRQIGITELLKNVRDVGYVGLGFLQSCYLVARYRPKVLFMRGGYVGVPLGFAARLFRKKYVTHDSDAVASLANRLIAGGASAHAVSANPKMYKYAAEKTVETGIPLNTSFQEVTPEKRQAARRALKLPENSSIVLVTGGGLGAARLNKLAAEVLLALLNKRPELYVLHLSGLAHQEAVKKYYQNHERALVFGYRTDLVDLSAASDVVITRAGATAMAEFATQHKAMIIVPNPLLTDGHQLHNARAYEESGAALVLREEELESELAPLLQKLLESSEECQKLGANAGKIVKSGAAARVVDLLQSLQQEKHRES